MQKRIKEISQDQPWYRQYLTEEVKTQDAPKPLGPYSQAVQAGDYVYVSGQISVDRKGKFVGDTIEMQTTQVIDNMQKILNAKGLDLEDVVSVDVTLARANKDFVVPFNKIYGKRFSSNPKPARRLAGGRLPPDFLVEMSCVAYNPRMEPPQDHRRK